MYEVNPIENCLNEELYNALVKIGNSEMQLSVEDEQKIIEIAKKLV